MNSKNWMLRHAAACFQTPMCSSKKRVLQHAAAAHAWCGLFSAVPCMKWAHAMVNHQSHRLVIKHTSWPCRHFHWAVAVQRLFVGVCTLVVPFFVQIRGMF